jgi:8-oxo-dGTP pyrophosphatase MutT (NUDIX family)
MNAEERSAGIVVYRIEDSETLYLLLHYIEGHWDFPKGHVEPGEDIEQTAKRELGEETGISEITLLPGFSAKVFYKFRHDGILRSKRVDYLLGETKTKEVVLSDEHKGFGWYVQYNARRRITYENSRNVLVKADRYLRQRIDRDQDFVC